MTHPVNRILVANRGEIACRVIRTARRLGIHTVAVYSDADAAALHVEQADEAIRIGPAPAIESYLAVDAIVGACRATGADAVHPGYGFLAEHAGFARACADAGITFIGPPADAMEMMGSKDAALDRADSVGVPVLPGYRGDDQSDDALIRAADAIGYPLLAKPVAGGGGKGMRIVGDAAGLADAIASSRRESAAAFGDDRLLLEKYLPRSRHVELQIFADDHGNVVHLFDRDCSIQRRHQKIVEEAPAPGLAKKTRDRMARAAIDLVRSIDYRGAGTVEFLVNVDAPTEFFFMEMNTRLQVEHPVTEMIVGADLVEWQIRVAAGEPLPLDQRHVRQSGCAIETRVYAEDPERDFLPATGTLTRFRMPAGDGIRVDTGVREGDAVGIHYDPMIAKIVVHGGDRDDAVRRLGRALDGCVIAGLPTNLSLLKRVAASAAFAGEQLDTGFVESLGPPEEAGEDPTGIAIACLHILLEQATAARDAGSRTSDPHSPWHALPGWRMNAPRTDAILLDTGGAELRVAVRHLPEGFALTLPSGEVPVRGRLAGDGGLEATVGGRTYRAEIVRTGNRLEVFYAGRHLRLTCEDRDQPGSHEELGSGRLVAPMPGRVISVLVGRDSGVEKGQALMVIEAMKMEHTINAPADGVVTAVSFSEGDLVEEGVELLTFEAEPGD